MTERLQPSAGCTAVIHLLDSTQGHPLQTWRFKNQELITIGRGEGNDVVLADQHVSRAHATIAYENEEWRIVSIGRHGTVINDRLISEARLTHQTLFRLGVEGPLLRFDTGLSSPTRTETLDNVTFDMLSMLEVDEDRKRAEVEQIVGDRLFQELKEQTRRTNTSNFEDTVS